MKSFKLSFKGKLSCTLSIALITGAGTAVAETNNTSIFFMSGMAAIAAQANEPVVAGGNSAPSVSSANNGATVINI
ncbi:hypothetical protein FIA56_07085, partial [Testudinibacter sp. TR-2022]